MIIKKIEIKKFRGFEDVEFDLGSQLTVIAGQNGTQKTTILGMLTQPFTITDDVNPMINEKPLCGGSFKSAFNQKFKLSDKFDLPKSHEWTLHLENEDKPFVVESIPRNGGGIRFWRKGNRAKGSGYIQLPVIYLSLSRLFPMGEDLKLEESSSITLTQDEVEFYKKYHNEILIIIDDKIKEANYLVSNNKNTLCATTEVYDWKQNSAGQDNIGKILLAILSFKRLQNKYQNDYKGGILAIDELDATLYPAAQIKLITALRKFASQFKIQIIFTTHSLQMIEKLDSLNKESSNLFAQNQIRIIFLEKKNGKIKISQNESINRIRNRINVSFESNLKPLKINTFSEDKETSIFVKSILKSKCAKLNFIDCSFGCSNLIDLSIRKVPSFDFPNSIIFLDGDVRMDRSKIIKIKKLKNFVILPTSQRPENIFADFLFNLDDESEVWKSINIDYTKQVCFKDYQYNQVISDRVKAKEWFNTQSKYWGKYCAKVINPWIEQNPKLSKMFVNDFSTVYNRFAKELFLEEIILE